MEQRSGAVVRGDGLLSIMQRACEEIPQQDFNVRLNSQHEAHNSIVGSLTERWSRGELSYRDYLNLLREQILASFRVPPFQPGDE